MSGRKAGMRFSQNTKWGYSKPHFKIRIVGNNMKGYSDHALIIENMFAHEEQHYKDYLRLGYTNFYTLAKQDITVIERWAIEVQMKHSSYQSLLNTGVHGVYREDVIDYGVKNNMLLRDLKPIQIKSVSK